MSTPSPRLLPWTILLAAGVPWGATFALTIMALGRGDHPVGIAIWQTVVGSVVLIVINAFRGKILFPVTRHHLVFYVVCGLLGTALPTVVFLYAADHVQAGVLSLSTAFVPIVTFAVAIAIRAERYQPLRTLGLLLGCGAIALITVPDTSLPNPDDWIWVIVVILGAVCYAFENIIIARYIPAETDPFVVLAGMLVAGTLLMLPVGIHLNALMVPAWPLEEVDWVIVALGIINVAAYGLFIVLINISGPVFASQMGYVVTLAGVAWGIVIFSEQHSLWFWSSLVMMMAGMALVQPQSNEPEAPVAIAHPGDHLLDQIAVEAIESNTE